jgi:hypothetical protein
MHPTINECPGLANGQNIVFLRRKNGIFYQWPGMDEKARNVNPRCKIVIKNVLL